MHTSYHTFDGINRHRYPLGSNHAELILDMPCETCGATFDVGFERARRPVFRQICVDCARKEL